MITTETILPDYNEIQVQNENLTKEYTADLFDDEGPFGEADCAGL